VIVAKDKLSKKTNIEKNYEVEFSFMNFQNMIISEKIRKKQEFSKGKLKFNSLYFANLINQNPSNQEFFMKESVQKLIDFQYMTTFNFFRNLFIVYGLGFALPFVHYLFKNHQLPAVEQGATNANKPASHLHISQPYTLDTY